MIERLESINSGERWQVLQNYRTANQVKVAVQTGSVQTNNASNEGNVRRETAVMRKDEAKDPALEKVKNTQIATKECKTCSKRQKTEETPQPKGLGVLYQQGGGNIAEFCPECGRLICACGGGSSSVSSGTSTTTSGSSSAQKSVDLSV
jgi:hypothetical protein